MRAGVGGDADPPPKVAGASIVTVTLKEATARVPTQVEEFDGTPARPPDRAALKRKFNTLTRARYGAEADALFERLTGLENETELSWIGA